MPYKDKEAKKEYMKKWVKRNKEHIKEYRSSLGEDYFRDRTKEWNKNNKGRLNQKTAKRRATKPNATVSWADKEAIERMYIVARFCTEHLGEDYHVDHIVPLQGKDVCGLHVESNLQVITAKENMSKGNR